MKKYTPKNLFYTLSFAAVIAVPLMFFSSCDLFKYKRIFPDGYYDNNFIENIGFDRAIASNAALPARAPAGVWDFAWRHANGYAVGSDPDSYMTLTPVAGGASFFGSTPAGLAASAPVFRLELVNLLSDGDFEGAPPLEGWTSVPATPVIFDFVNGVINGKSLKFELLGETNSVKYEFPLPPEVSGAEYNLFFNWNSTSPSSIIASVNDTSTVIFPDNKKHVSVGFTSASPNSLTFKTESLFTLVIDDLSLKRTLARPELRLFLSPGHTEPSLMNMLYRFSIWVHVDPDVNPVKSPYHLSELTLNIVQLQYTQLNSMTVKPGIYTYNLSNTGWQKIEAYISSGGNPQFPEDAVTPVLELVVSLAESLPGCVLLAQPELRAYPDGY